MKRQFWTLRMSVILWSLQICFITCWNQFWYYFFYFLIFLAPPKVLPHIADEIERANNMQFLRYLSSHDYEFYWECLWCDLLLILFGKFAHLKTYSLSKSSKYFTEWIGISLLPPILILKLWSKFAFFDLNSTSSVFLILRLNLLAFRN